MVIVTEHTMDERDATITKIATLRLVAADPSVEIIELLDGQGVIVGTFSYAIQTDDSAFMARVLAAMAPKPEHVTHTSWHAYTHQRGLPKFTAHLDWEAYDALCGLVYHVDDTEEVDKAICTALVRYAESK